MWGKKKTIICIFIIGSILSVSLIAFLLSMPPLTPSEMSPLHTSGHYIFDASGKRVNLYFPSIQNGGQSQQVQLNDIETIDALGFNGFRLGIYWGLIQPYNETLQGIDVTYFTTVRQPMGHGLDEVVDWAVQRHLYIELCLSWTTTWTPPSWAFPSVSNFGQRYASLIDGTASRERTGIVNTWRYIANRYRDIPNVIFEFLNEPEIPSVQKSLAGSAYKTFNEEIVTAIESVEAISHLKIVEFLLDSTSWVEILPPDVGSDVGKSNVLWASHTYVPMYNWNPASMVWVDEPFTWNGEFFDEGQHNQTVYVAWRLIRMANRAHEFNKPWIDTEFGKDVNQQYWDAWFDIVLKVSQDYSITGWAIFTYCPLTSFATGYNIKYPATQSLVMEKLRPYMIQP